jgi:hypothetical protein
MDWQRINQRLPFKKRCQSSFPVCSNPTSLSQESACSTASASRDASSCSPSRLGMLPSLTMMGPQQVQIVQQQVDGRASGCLPICASASQKQLQQRGVVLISKQPLIPSMSSSTLSLVAWLSVEKDHRCVSEAGGLAECREGAQVCF